MPLERLALLVLLAPLSAFGAQRAPSRRYFVSAGASASAGVSMAFGWPGQAPAAAGALRATNEVVKTVDGVRRKRLGGTGIEVSELALGTQRWGGTDYNSPDEALCHAMLDRGVLEGGINLLDTAAQYPIPSGAGAPAGRTEEIIGSWIRKSAGRRNKIVIASKITGGRNVNKRNILADCDASLRRLGVDQLDVYMLHWPARYTPQANWGQSLEYDWDLGRQTVPAQTQFSEIVEAMAELERAGKIRGYGACNDNAVGLMGMAAAARVAGVAGPCAMQNDYSLINRRTEENGLSEASSPALENCGFMAYNVLAGGMLTGKYDAVPAAVDDADRARAETNARAPRGRMDTRGWGNTLGRYRTAAARDAAMRYAALARDFGLSGPTELALRFAASRPAVTTSLVGHTSLAQLDESVAAFRATARKPLSRELLWEIDRVHLRNRLPLFANDEAGSDWFNEGAIGERIP